MSVVIYRGEYKRSEMAFVRDTHNDASSFCVSIKNMLSYVGTTVTSVLNKIYNILSFAVIALTVGVLFFGVSHFSMIQHMGGQISRCVLMPTGHTSPCALSPMEHIVEHVQTWQNAFTALLTKDVLVVLALLSVLVSLSRSTFLKILSLQYQRALRMQHAFVESLRYAPSDNPLQEAYASGVLNTKVF